MASQVRPREMPKKAQKRNVALAIFGTRTRIMFHPKGLRWIKPRSDKRREINVVYERAVRAWRAFRTKLDGFQCQFSSESGRRCQKKAHRRPHHKAGRIGPMLIDMAYFMAVCLNHHRYIHANGKESRRKGYLIDVATKRSNRQEVIDSLTPEEDKELDVIAAKMVTLDRSDNVAEAKESAREIVTLMVEFMCRAVIHRMIKKAIDEALTEAQRTGGKLHR